MRRGSLLTKQRGQKAAKRFLAKAISRNGTPEKINIDKSGANAAAIVSYNNEHGATIIIRKNKYLNNFIEQDHHGVKRITRPMMGFKSFEAAQATLTGIELIRMLRKGQLDSEEMQGLTVAEQFNKLAAQSSRKSELVRPSAPIHPELRQSRFATHRYRPSLRQ